MKERNVTSGKNPYTLLFGKEPVQAISRAAQKTEILEAFCAEPPTQQIYMLTGVRGAGKTVFMTEISKEISARDGWIVVELNPETDLLQSFAAKLSSENQLAKIFQNAKINLSFFGLGMEISGVAPITDIELAIGKMLESLKKQKKRVLVTIDEAVSTKEMRIFANAFQIFIRQELPLYLLMTGLYENIYLLQNEKTLTFLYRAPKVELKSLNISAVARQYQKTFGLSEEDSLKMAKLTDGYPFAFQVLGFFTWENGGNYRRVIEDYRQYLEDYVYEKIWAELSPKDRQIVHGIARSKNGKVSEIREILSWETNEFNPYRKRLLRKGLINGDSRGYVTFTLPFFKEFVLVNEVL